MTINEIRSEYWRTYAHLREIGTDVPMGAFVNAVAWMTRAVPALFEHIDGQAARIAELEGQVHAMTEHIDMEAARITALEAQVKAAQTQHSPHHAFLASPQTMLQMADHIDAEHARGTESQ